MSAVTQTQFSTFVQQVTNEIKAIKLDVNNKVASATLGTLQKAIFDELGGLATTVTKAATDFEQHLQSAHKQIEDRLVALEGEAKLKFAQVEELNTRLGKAEAVTASASRSGTDFFPSDRTNIQGAKLTVVYDQETGTKILFRLVA